MIFVFIFAMILGLVYALGLLWVAMQWESMPVWKHNNERKSQTGFSVIVPLRNESGNLNALILCFSNLNYNKDLFEVLFVNDHSSDSSLEQLKNTDFPFKATVLSLNDDSAGKKKALDLGVSNSNFDWVLTTDADCTFGPEWLSSLDAFISQYQPVMVCGPVNIPVYQSNLQNYEALEFCALVSAGGATLTAGFPTTCNGANLAYQKKVFMEVGGYDGNWHIPAGDDEFLMKKVFGRYGNKVRFIKSTESIVNTSACNTFGEMWNQRLRWASKIRKHKKRDGFIAQIFLFVLCLALVFIFISTLLHPFRILMFLSLLFVKISADWLFFKACLPFFNRENSLKSLLMAQFYQIYFILSIGIFSFIKTYQWKGRKL